MIHYATEGIRISRCGRLDLDLSDDLEVVSCKQCNPPPRKECTGCHHWKPVDCFYVDNRTRDGRARRCKACWPVGKRNRKTHYQVDGLAVCGRPNVILTTTMTDVSCLKCEQTIRVCHQCKKPKTIHEYPAYETSTGMTRRRTRCADCRHAGDDYGDSSFKGRGKLCCRLCGKPYRDHPRPRPCEFVGKMVA